MNAHLLAALVAREFEAHHDQQDQSIVKVKEGNLRDVVTGQDLGLDALARQFLAAHAPCTQLLCEEDPDHARGLAQLASGDLLVVDPLDGSNNFALTLPGYGFMACHLTGGRTLSSVVVLPEQDLYLVWTPDGLISSRSARLGAVEASAPTYYAYPPRLSTSEVELRERIMRLIDEKSSGLYRYGSACVALFNVLAGRHQAFIGHRIRVWDGLAYLPMLHAVGLRPRYSISGRDLDLIVGYNEDLVEATCDLFRQQRSAPLHMFDPTTPLEVL